jgi:hypothetical protein
MMKALQKYQFYKYLLLAGFFVAATTTISAEDLRRIVNLEGYWKFSVGDMAEWSGEKFNDSDWDELRVPGKWEEQGYNDYNGYAWYRKKFHAPDIDLSNPIYLVLGRIDDVDEVYLNGKLLGGSGSVLPEFKTAYNVYRKYIIPKGYLNLNGQNTIAIRVYDDYLDGGIINGPAGIYFDEDNQYLDYQIEGQWKFHLGDNKQWKSVTFDDALWPLVNVPSDWESQGFANYDGYAWYRKEFYLPADISNKDMYLSLGKIDDIDYVYINGEYIGSVYDLDKNQEYRRKGYEYNARRIYKIPAGLLKSNGKNVIAIRVYDSGLRGGIYEGPIGLINESNYQKYRRKYSGNQSFWDYIIDEFFID